MDLPPDLTQRMIGHRRGVLSGSAGVCALLWLVAATPAVAAAAPAEPYLVDACPASVYVDLRIAARADLAERSYRFETCGTGRDRSHDVPDGGFKVLSFTGEHGELDVRLQLRDGDKVLAYEALAMMLGTSERMLQRIGHHDGPDVMVVTTRDTYGDHLALHVVNTPARQVATDLARTKQLHFVNTERVTNARVTFLFDEIPVRGMVEFLAEISDLKIQRTGERDYVVGSAYRFPAEWRVLNAAHEKASTRDKEAIEAKMLTLAGEPERREDVDQNQIAELHYVAQWMSDSSDPKRAIVPLRRLVALLKLRSFNVERDVDYADALAQLAKVLTQASETDEASALLGQAVAIIERTDGPQSRSLTAPLLQQAALAERLGMKVSAHDMLVHAIAVADPAQRPTALLQLAAVHAEEGHYDDVAATLNRVYPLLPEHGQWYDEVDIEHPYKIHDAFVDLEHKAIRERDADKAEVHHRHLVAVETQRFGADSSPAAYETYALGRNLFRQNKLDDAAAQIERSLHFATKQPEPSFFQAGALRYLAEIRLAQHNFAGAARTWQDMAALRTKVYGSNHVRVVRALREAAMLDLLAGRNADARDASRRADEAETGKRTSPPLPAFAKVADDLKEGLAFDLVLPIVDRLRDDIAKLTTLDEPLRVRNDALATQFEAYAESVLHMQNDTEAAVALYLYAASLRYLSRGRDHAETQHAAKRAVELCQRLGQKELAEKLRKSYALDH